MQRHRYVEIIARYFNGANAGDASGMLPCFSDDIAVYTTGVPPRFGASAVARHFVDIQPALRARWTIDHAVVQEPEAVVEWSVLWIDPETQQEALSRGIDWFVFDANDRIRQIREFLITNHPLAGKQLEHFPYAERGYPIEANLDARLPN
jgi:ketosteroid isomerase-like protein